VTKLFLVLPEIPSDGKILQDSVLTTGMGWGQVGGLSYLPQTSKCWTFKKSRASALDLAQHYSKTYNCPYYIAEVDIYGRYAPPPPAFEPVFEESSNWQVPK